MNYIEEYYYKLKSGEITGCKKILAVYKHLYEKTKYLVNDGFHFDENKANRPIEFIERFLHLSKGKSGGQLMKLELFQKALISAIFGFVDDDGLRQYREVMLVIARKNGKSCIASAIAIYSLIADHEPTPEVCSLATKRDQAKICWEEAVRMIRKSPELSGYCKTRVGDIYASFNEGTFKPLSSDSKTLDGLNISTAILDEMAAWENKDLYDLIADSQSAREQPLILITTTQGFIRGNIFDSKYAQAEATIAGYTGGEYQDHRFLPIIYELDSKEEYKNPDCWIKANPGLGTIKDFVQLSEKVNRAKAGHKDLQDLLVKDFNFQTGGARSFLSWDDIRSTEKFSTKDIIKQETYGIWGVDLSRTTDLSSAICIFKIASQPDKIYVLHRSWITSEALDKNIEGKIPYQKWINNGYMDVCPGNLIDYKVIVEWMEEVRNNFGIFPYKIMYDNYSASYLVSELENLYGKTTCVSVGQTAKALSIPLEKLKCLLEVKNLVFNADPCLSWQLSNLQVTEDAKGNYRIFKNRNLDLRNDAACAILDALRGLIDFGAEYNVMIDDKN